MDYAHPLHRPMFSTPIRWALRVLAWLAFGVSAYLAWHAVNQSSVAGCGVGAENACDVVLSSSWSKWLGLPVAVAGLACYASLAGLSVMLGLQTSQASRWISPAFVMLSIVAAGASLWFIAIQVVAIGSFCPFCIVTDLCGIAIGALAIWSLVSWWNATPQGPQPRHADASLFALRAAVPAAGTAYRSAPVVQAQASSRPSLLIALGGACALLAFLIAGQVVFPTKTYSLQSGTLDKPLELTGTAEPDPRDQAKASDAQPHVAMRIPARDGDASGEPIEPAREGEPSDDPTESSEPAPSPSPRKRLVKFLGGNLSLDVYKHPLIGSPEAPHVMVEMVSYDCPHCRKMHHIMEKGRARYGDQMAILVMPVPLEMSCNKMVTDPKASHRGACATARFALGVAALQPRSFEKLHNWLMSGDKKKPPALEKLIPKAYAMVDRDRLRTLTRGEQLNKQIAEYVNLFGKLRNRPGAGKDFGLPVQILGDKVLSGTVEKEKEVFAAWEEHLGVKPR
jgi:uncharacterized membrane protein